MRSVARQFGLSLSTVQHWVRRAGTQRLDRIDFATHATGPASPVNRTPAHLEDRILDLRKTLKIDSDLGEYGALAIHRELHQTQLGWIPSIRTIGRILERRGALDGVRRQRRPAPPLGWYLPEVVSGYAEVDAFDIIEDLRIQDGPLIDVLNAISLHGGLVASWPQRSPIKAIWTQDCILNHWRQIGLPGYGQFDNDTRFQGAHHHPDSLGRVIRICLQLGVVPVFIPPAESGFQATIESYNGRWQRLVWHRFHHQNLTALTRRSDRFVKAVCTKQAERIERAPARRPFPLAWKLNFQRPVAGRVIYLRRTDEKGRVRFLGHTWSVDRHWLHRLVRCEVFLDHSYIRMFALRRRDPDHQPLLNEVPYVFPNKSFTE